MIIDLEKAKKEFLKYTENYDLTNENINRKQGHSIRVMNISKQIATELNLTEEQIQIAALIGLLHDIARFEQYTQYQTYNDNRSFDHGDYGVEILDKDIRKYIETDKYDKIIKVAIKNHNKFEIEEGLNEEELLFSKLIRDADKIDILYETIWLFWKGEDKAINNTEVSTEVMEKFEQNKLAVFGLIIIVIVTGACIIGKLTGIDYATPVLPEMKKPPSAEHWFGTDTMGRDLFARVLVGGCYSIFIGVFCSVMSAIVGAGLGALAGYFGGKIDAVLVRISELFQTFPQTVLIMMLVAIIKQRGMQNLIFIFIVTGWMTTFRMVRNEYISLKQETYVKVCEAFGISKSNIMFKQILPNVKSPIIVSITTNVAAFILSEAGISFIGLGIADSTPTWGNILNIAKAASVVTNQWWIWLFPGLAISLFSLAINFLGDGLRDVMDAKQQ